MQDLATACGVSAWQTVQQWEKEGGTAPKRGRLEKVAIVLQTSTEWLMTGREPGGGAKAITFNELNGPEAQLVMLYRSLREDSKRKLLDYANTMANGSPSQE